MSGHDLDALASGANPEDEPIFRRVFRETYVSLRASDAPLLRVPWGPVIDVIFHPQGDVAAPGGHVRIVARARGGVEVELASATIMSADQPLTLRGSMGCLEYVVMGARGPNQNDTRVESYVSATVYSLGGPS